MKKLLYILIAVLALNSTAMAQLDKGRTVSTRIADLLAQVPAGSEAELRQNAEEVAQMGEEGILQMAGMFAAPGKGDNSRLEYALGGFSYYVTQKGQDSRRQLAEKAYIASLGKVSDPEVKNFFIRQLALVGSDASVDALQSYLLDQRLGSAAAKALAQIGGAAAGEALLKAFEKAEGNARLPLAASLAELGYAQAVPALGELAESEDPSTRKVALNALAGLGDPAAAKIMRNAAAAADYRYDDANASGAYLAYLGRLKEKGETATAGKLAKKLLKQAGGEGQVHTRSAALKLLTDLGGERNLPVLVKAMKDSDPAFRRAALKYAMDLESPAAAALWVKELQRNKNADVQAEIIGMLGEARVKSALPVVTGFLQSNNQGVRHAAIKAAQQIGGVEALGGILAVLKRGDQADVKPVAQALKVMQGEGLPAQVAAAVPALDGPAKSAMIGVLAARGADQHLNVVLPELKSSDPAVRAASLSALKDMVSAKDVPVLFGLLDQASDPKEISQIQDALVVALAATEGQDRQTALVLEQMNKAGSAKQARYFRLLGSVGGKESLQAVASAYAKGDASSKEAALDALVQWGDSSAVTELYKIGEKASGAQAEKAIDGYISLVSKAAYPPAQKLLQLRKAMSLASSTKQKQRILNEVQKTATFPALMYAGSFLDDPALQQAAAQAVMNIALDHKEYYGTAVRELVTKTIGVLKGQDSDYQKEALRKHLAEMPAGEGFEAIFNGKDLSGWKGLVANPIKRAQMDPATLAREQAKADKVMREGWFAENGELVFSGHGDNICTVEKYGDFEMFVDWKIEKDGDAGIYLRGTPQVQIWDTARVDVGAQVGSGGLYNNQKHESKPLKLADNAIGDWNNFHIIMKGEKVTVYLNGELVVDNVVLENFWDRSLPIFPEEQIELQAHGTRVAYRDIYVRRLSDNTKKFTLSEEEKKEGFEVLFDGTNLDNWTGNKEGYVVENGDIVIYPEKGNGNLFTKNEYSDFVFRFEFQLTPGANNGLGIRAPLSGDAAYQGMELQILDNTADIYKDLQVYQYHGSVYGVIPAKRGFLKPVGEWNQQEVIVKGNKVKVILNGEVILDGDIAEASKNGTLDKRDHPGLKKKSGHIGFLGHGSVVRFRNIRIKDLSK